MGGVFIFKPFLCIFVFLITHSLADNNHHSPTTSPPPLIQPNLYANASYSPFKPSIAVVVGVLTTVFSITFLLLLYAKHCRRENGVVSLPPLSDPYPLSLSTTTRKNSGIDRTVIESLPIFRFGALRGHKDGLECAVCLAKFEPMEVLRLLPKCKHAFHVECVDTWLDGHSTCPLCRYRVDPEDILLIEDHYYPKIISANSSSSSPTTDRSEPPPPELRRVSGRHSSAGEFSFSSCSRNPTSFRRSLDGAGLPKKGDDKGEVSVAVGCFDRPRKDGSLLTDGLMAGKKSFEKRFEHRIIISASGASGLHHQRWSDVQPSDLLYIRSEMLIGDSRRFSLGSSRPSVKRQQQKLMSLLPSSVGIDGCSGGGGNGSGSGVINSRSVSEITGLSRLSNREESNSTCNRYRTNHRQRHAGLLSRWLAWISSQSQSLPAVRSDCTYEISNVV